MDDEGAVAGRRGFAAATEIWDADLSLTVALLGDPRDADKHPSLQSSLGKLHP